MARNVTETDVRHAASSVQVEERLSARHIDYRFEPNYAVESIADAEGHQVRLLANRAPTEMVTRYAQQMKAGAIFPAVVLNDRGELIDGNTRRQAALKAGRTSIAAYICRGMTPLQARSLSVELNQANGLPMSERELHAYVRSAVLEGQGLDLSTCARMTGVRPSTLERWKSQAQFEVRAKRSGIREFDAVALADGVQAALNGVRLTPVFIEATALAVAARMSVSSVRTMVAEANAAPSESLALAVVAAEREARADGIKSVANGFSPKRRRNRSAMHVAALLNLGVDELLDVAPEKREGTITRLRELRAHVDRALLAEGASPASVDDGAGRNAPMSAQLCVQGASDG